MHIPTPPFTLVELSIGMFLVWTVIISIALYFESKAQMQALIQVLGE